VIKASIDHQISTQWIRYRQKIADCIRPKIRLSEMPEFPAKVTFFHG
jgi:hypothetical protein